jgi:hypothetical protein
MLSRASASRADVIFNNFGPGDTFPDVGRIIQGEAVNNIGDVDQAVGFTVPGSQNFDLTDVYIGLGIFDSPINGEGPINIDIAADSNGLPGGVLKTYTVNVNATGPQIAHGSGGSTLQLNANTQYWVIGDGKTTFEGGWEYNPSGEMGGPTAGRSDNGPWSLHLDDKTRMVMRLEGRELASPEPSSIIHFALGIVGIAPLRGRRNRPVAC